MITPNYFAAIKIIIDHCNPDEVKWAITGSFGFALQGMDIRIHDIDIQTDKTGAFEIEKRLSEFLIQPVRFSSTDAIRSYFGILNINDIKVEIMGDIQKRLPDGTWEPPVTIVDKTHLVNCAGLLLPVLNLDYEYEAYLKLGRTERARQVKEFLDKGLLESKHTL